jgi:hypothetical protein
MSARDSRSFGREIATGFVLAACGAAALAALTPFFGWSTALRAVIALLGFAAVLDVLASSRERVGRVTTVAAWTLGAAIAAGVPLPLTAYVLVHAGLLWLVRALYRYSSLVPALGDFALCLLGAAFAAWAAQRTGSAWLALWCFFLVQSFHVLLPESLNRTAGDARDDGVDAFTRAQRAAEAAVRRMSTPR